MYFIFSTFILFFTIIKYLPLLTKSYIITEYAFFNKCIFLDLFQNLMNIQNLKLYLRVAATASKDRVWPLISRPASSSQPPPGAAAAALWCNRYAASHHTPVHGSNRPARTRRISERYHSAAEGLHGTKTRMRPARYVVVSCITAAQREGPGGAGPLDLESGTRSCASRRWASRLGWGQPAAQFGRIAMAQQEEPGR